MASQVAQGLYLLSAASLRGYQPAELSSLKQELEKLQREARAETPPLDDAQANQLRNRKIARISSALQIITNQLSVRR
jgi:hypothetical protein